MNLPNVNNVLVLASALIRNSQGKILLLQRSQVNKSFQGLWQLPEGKMRFGEQARQTLARELKEELHLKLKKEKLLLTSTVVIRSRNQRFHLLRIVFSVQYTGTIQLTPEHSAYCWCTVKQLPIPLLFPGTKAIFDKLKK